MMARSRTSFQEGNTLSLTHGARAYDRRVSADKPITIPMAEVEQSVLAELREAGPRGIIEAETVKNATIARLLWAAMNESQEKFLSLVKSYFYASNNAVRGAVALAHLPKDDGAPAAGEILASYKQVSDEPTE